MIQNRAAITAVNGWVPEYRLTNAILETMVETSDEWIKSRTGISERRILKGEGLGTSHMAIHAVKGLMEKRGITPEEVDLLICATTTGDHQFPATANIISDGLGIKNAFSFDIGAACSGFLFALETGTRFIESGVYKKVIIVGADKMSSIVDYTDRTTCVIFGDGAGAVLLEPSTEDVGIIDSDLHSDGSGKRFLHQKAGGSVKPATLETVANREHFVHQEGAAVFKAAVKGMSGAIGKVMKDNDLSIDMVDWVVPHQANKRIIDSVARMASFPEEKVMINIHKFGNTTSATIPLCLWEWEDKLKKGDRLILTAFGGGFTWGAIYLKWAYTK